MINLQSAFFFKTSRLTDFNALLSYIVTINYTYIKKRHYKTFFTHNTLVFHNNLMYSLLGSKISQKWVFAILGFLAIAIGNAYRVLLSMAIPEMVLPIKSPAIYLDDTCPSTESFFNTNQTIVTGKLYDWDEYTQVSIIIKKYKIFSF